MNLLRSIVNRLTSKSAYRFYAKAWRRIGSVVLFLLKAVPVAVFVILLYEYFHEDVVIRSFTVTKTLTEEGFTDVVASEELRQRIYAIKQKVSLNERAALGIALTQEQTDITIPTTGVSINTIFDAFSQVMPWMPRTTISGDFINEGSKLRLVVFVNQKEVSNEPQSPAFPTPDALIEDAAYKIVEVVHPLWRSVDLYNRGKLSDAAGLLTKVINRSDKPNEDVAEAQALLGKILLDQRQNDEACKRLTNSLAIDPYNVDAYRYLSQLNATEGNQPLAIGDAQRAVTLTGGRDSWSYYVLGTRYYEQSDWPDAQRVYSRAIDLWYGNRYAHDALGRVRESMGKTDDLEAALNQFDIAAALGDDPFPVSLDDEGSALQSLGRLDEARRAFLEAIAADPSLRQAYDDLGTLYYNTNVYHKAAADFFQAIRLDSDDSVAYSRFRLAVRSEVTGRQQSAVWMSLSDADVCTAGRENLRGARDLAALRYVAHLRCTILDRERHDLVEALKANHNLAKPYAGLGMLYYKEGNYGRAVLEFLQALRLDRHDSDAYTGFKEAMSDETNVRQRKTVLLSFESAHICDVAHENLHGVRNAGALRDVARMRCSILGERVTRRGGAQESRDPGCVVDGSPFQVVSTLEMMPDTELFYRNAFAEWIGDNIGWIALALFLIGCAGFAWSRRRYT